MFKLFSLVAFLLFLTNSCQKEYNYPPEITKSLNEAGKNRGQIVKVLEHYKENPEDSLKYLAASYLIANMTGHYSRGNYTEEFSVVSSAFLSMDSLVRKNYFTPYNEGSIEEKNAKSSIIVSQIRSTLLKSDIDQSKSTQQFLDLQVVKSEWLIDHIDNAFIAWKTSNFAKNLSFSDFKVLILPYRYMNEVIDHTSTRYRNQLVELLKPNRSKNINEIVNKVNVYSTAMSCIQKSDKLLGDIGPYDILQFHAMGCDRHSEWTARVLNTCGIPAYLDFTPSWLNRSRKHYWVSVRDTTGKHYAFTPMWQALNDTTYFNETSKVFRRSFTPEPSPFSQKNEGEEVPSIFNTPFIKDVSEEYHPVADISVPQNLSKNKFSYLSIFSINGWEPVAWGENNSKTGTATFKKMPLFVLYTPGYYSNNKIVANGDPFYLDGKGHIKSVKPMKNKLVDLVLRRKFHEKGHLIEMMENMLGAKIQGASKSDFSDASDLHILALDDLSHMNEQSIRIHNENSFRYLRIIPQEGKSLNIATFHVLSENKNQKKETITKKPKLDANLTRTRLRALNDTSDYSKAFDDDPETFVTPKSMEIDLIIPTKISEILIAPRNSNNGIIKGDNYELFYYDEKWISCGIQKALSNTLTFKKIPSETLYWLRNHDRGKEEQAFLFKNGKQIFINEDNYINSKWIPFRELN